MAKDKIYTIRVSIDDDLYRDIMVRGSHSLYKFAEHITRAFDFYFDHAFGFFSRTDRSFYDSEEAYELFADMDNLGDDETKSKSVKKTNIDTVYQTGKKMLFLFDYGDDWFFLTECIDVKEEEGKKQRLPKVIKSVGKAPEQYPEYDEDYDDED